MDPLQPGHYWKTPFLWELGCKGPTPPPAGVAFAPIAVEVLASLIGRAMANSRDQSDQHAVATHGEPGAAEDLLSFAPEYFSWEPGWWRCARTEQGNTAGFVLPVVFKAEDRCREGRPQGTIFYMGVMPEYRGQGFGKALVDEATRVFTEAKCWRIFCDTGTDNEPMVRAFRSCGYIERKPWQRPVA
jgi:ribosomal protein S18 acetylase RimI-like enzyme